MKICVVGILITDDNFITFGVKGLLQASKNIRNALLFNVLSYMSEQLLTKGNTVASIDEFYLMLNNLTAVEYVRNFMKRVRKKESAVILASQNIEDFLVESVRELTKPLLLSLLTNFCLMRERWIVHFIWTHCN